jgi:hypothetical protein
MKTNLKYGMVLEIPVNPIEYNFMGMFGVSSSNSEEIKTLFTVERYWDNDKDPNVYKVKCVPIDKSGKFGVEKFYSSDLSSLIRKGHIKIVE